MIGPVILDLIGTEISAEEQELLQHPLVGGVILFTRNYESLAQVTSLCKSIRQSRTTPLLITVDHEGGRVQRFQKEFTRLPSMGVLGSYYDENSQAALQLAEACGYILAAELLSVGVDLSFTPVLDLDKGVSTVIGNRAFHRQPHIIIELSSALMKGLRKAGMAAVGKHFPGHGSVNLDSHLAMPIDPRSFDEIAKDDLVPFARLIQSGLPAVMPAHILFPEIDNKPVGFSDIWLKKILREQLKFSGVIFSDDLEMKGADGIGDHVERAKEALAAGCDMILICNNRSAAIKILDHLPQNHMVDEKKFKMMQGDFSVSSNTAQSSLWKEKYELLNKAMYGNNKQNA